MGACARRCQLQAPLKTASNTATPLPITKKQLSVELAQEGLVLPAERAGPMRALVSSLLLRLDALAAAGLLTAEQFASLRNQAWAQDFALVRAYQTVG